MENICPINAAVADYVVAAVIPSSTRLDVITARRRISSEVIVADLRASLVVPGAIRAFTCVIIRDIVGFTEAVAQTDVAYGAASAGLGALITSKARWVFDLVNAIAERATRSDYCPGQEDE